MTCFWVLNCCLQTTKVRLLPHLYFLFVNCHIPKGTHDRSKKVVHVANTEQRIAFKEVTLIPKAPKEQETKDNDKEETNTVNLEETPKDSFLSVDRIIGLYAPASRAPRKKKATSTSATKSKATAKGKEKAGTSKPSNAKGKEKEVPTEDVPMDEDAFETNNIDDIYMDE